MFFQPIKLMAYLHPLSLTHNSMKIHGVAISTATMRVLACAYEKQVDFDFVPVDMSTGEHKKPPYLSLNPFGKVPTLEDGDLKLIESRAITQYLAHGNEGSGTQLLNPPPKMAVMSMWMEVEAHQFDPVAAKLCWELVYKPIFGMTADEAVVKENEAKLSKVLDVYEDRLSESKYLGSDCFTLADLHHLPTVHYLMGTEIKKQFESRPKVCAWVADITARPAWGKVVAMQSH